MSFSLSLYIYIYIYLYTHTRRQEREVLFPRRMRLPARAITRLDGSVESTRHVEVKSLVAVARSRGFVWMGYVKTVALQKVTVWK